MTMTVGNRRFGKKRRSQKPVSRMHRLGMESLEQCAMLAVFTVTNTMDSGLGSLRQAILDSNTMAGADDIAFNIPGPGPHTIAPTSALPFISDPVTIDGYTQPGSTPTRPPLDLRWTRFCKSSWMVSTREQVPKACVVRPTIRRFAA